MLAIAYLLLSAQPVRAQNVPADKPVSFMDHVAPILKENCFACHDAKKRKGKLDLTTFERLLKGGDQGETVTAGKPEESNLFLFMSGKEEPAMPPKEAGGLLPKDKVAVVERWIKEGAKYDGPSPQADLVAELRRRWNPPTPPASYPFPSIVRSLVFSPDGKRLIVGGYHELLIWDHAAGKLLGRLRTRSERANAMVFLPDGKTLVVAGGRPGQEGDVRLYNLEAPPGQTEGEVAIWNGVDPKAGVLTKELLQSDDEVLCLAISPDGKKLATGGCDRVVRVWNIAEDWKLEQSIENHADWVFGVQFAPDNTHLLTCSRDKTAKVWDLAAKESVLTFPDHQNAVYAVAVKPDGKLGISGGEDNQLRFWNASGEGKQVRASGGHGKAIWKVLVHPNKPIIVTASSDGTVRTWNPENGQALKTLTGHNDYIYALAISPDGSLVASGAWNGEIRIHKVDDGSVVKAFNASPGLAPAP
jgi:WD40 repeat protein/mono/diheme cytochrome c family protein